MVFATAIGARRSTQQEDTRRLEQAVERETERVFRAEARKTGSTIVRGPCDREELPILRSAASGMASNIFDKNSQGTSDLCRRVSQSRIDHCGRSPRLEYCVPDRRQTLGVLTGLTQ